MGVGLTSLQLYAHSHVVKPPVHVFTLDGLHHDKHHLLGDDAHLPGWDKPATVERLLVLTL